jgi:uncharacterized protein YbcI
MWEILITSVPSSILNAGEYRNYWKNNKRQQSILCQFKTNKVENLKKDIKIKMYKMMKRPVVTYWSETWTLTAKDKNNLRIFKRQILRKIFGPVNIDNIWRIRNNMESDKLIEGADTVRCIKAQRIKWLGHIQRMGQARLIRKL